MATKTVLPPDDGAQVPAGRKPDGYENMEVRRHQPQQVSAGRKPDGYENSLASADGTPGVSAGRKPDGYEKWPRQKGNGPRSAAR